MITPLPRGVFLAFEFLTKDMNKNLKEIKNWIEVNQDAGYEVKYENHTVVSHADNVYYCYIVRMELKNVNS